VRDSNAKIYDTKSRKLLAVAEKINNLYYITGCVKNLDNRYEDELNELFTNVTKFTNKEKRHRAMGNVNFQ